MRRTVLLAALLAGACSSSASLSEPSASTGPSASPESPDSQSAGSTERAGAPTTGRAEAIFAGGCFWCMEAPFESIDGVDSVTSGYTGGRVAGPSYEEVSSGRTGHAEAVRIVFDPSRVTYEQLLEVFWHNVDPTQADGQFCDHGTQYRSALFPVDGAQRAAAEASRARVAEQLGRPIVTQIEDPAAFWIAEAYHQDYYRTHPLRYQTYRTGCGRDRRLREVWGDAAAAH